MNDKRVERVKREAIEFDPQQFLNDCVEEVAGRLKQELLLYQEYFYSGLSQDAFARSRKMKRHYLDNIRRRYALPSPAPGKREVIMLKNKQDRENMLCTHADCKTCAYLERAWRVDRKIID